MINIIISALAGILTKLVTEKVVTEVVRIIVKRGINWLVKTTETTVDDEIAAPLLKAMDEKPD